jgi:hypothetical protein
VIRILKRNHSYTLFLLGLIMVATSLAGCTAQYNQSESSTGTQLNIFLDVDEYPEMIIEIDSVQGYEPSNFALNGLVREIGNLTGRTEHILLRDEVLDPQGMRDSWSAKEALEYAAAHRDTSPPGTYHKGSAAVMHILFLSGEYADSYAAIAIAQTSTIIVFRGDVETPSAPYPDTSNPSVGDLASRAVLIHEAGHTFGLVNNGVPMVNPHADPEDPHHSSNADSVMKPGIDYFDAQQGWLLGGAGPPFRFDDDDLADVRAFQARMK